MWDRFQNRGSNFVSILGHSVGQVVVGVDNSTVPHGLGVLVNQSSFQQYRASIQLGARLRTQWDRSYRG